MTVATNALQHMDLWMRRSEPAGSSPAAPRPGGSLEEALMPAVRCAVRSGLGAPALVRWVRGALRDLHTPEGPAPISAGVERELCQRLVRHLRSRPAPSQSSQDTVVGL